MKVDYRLSIIDWQFHSRTTELPRMIDQLADRGPAARRLPSIGSSLANHLGEPVHAGGRVAASTIGVPRRVIEFLRAPNRLVIAHVHPGKRQLLVIARQMLLQRRA
jgi:hypothetical protein